MTGQQLPMCMLTVPERFEQFHHENPIVYQTLVRLAREWKARTDSPKMAIAMLFEAARWEIALSTSDPDYKINNNYKPFYARLIMAKEPDLSGLFNLRAAEADEWIESRIA